MAFPQVSEFEITAFSADTTSHSVTLPTTASGNLLLIHAGFNRDTSATNITTPTEYSFTDFESDKTATIFYVSSAFARVCDGTESGQTIDVATTDAQAGVVMVWQIYDWGGTIADDIDFGRAQALNDDPNSPEVTTGWGSADNLVISSFVAGDDDATVVTYPYADNNDYKVSGAGTNAGQTGGGCSDDITGSVINPGAFLISESDSWLAYTFIIEPGASGSAPSAGASIIPQGTNRGILRGLGRGIS